MRMWPGVFAVLLALGPREVLGQADPIWQDRYLEEGPEQDGEHDLKVLHPAQLEDRSGDWWYGESGVRPGGDLLEPVLDLIRRPSGLWDLRPRKVRSYLPDRETAEFLRDRR